MVELAAPEAGDHSVRFDSLRHYISLHKFQELRRGAGVVELAALEML